MAGNFFKCHFWLFGQVEQLVEIHVGQNIFTPFKDRQVFRGDHKIAVVGILEGPIDLLVLSNGPQVFHGRLPGAEPFDRYHDPEIIEHGIGNLQGCLGIVLSIECSDGLSQIVSVDFLLGDYQYEGLCPLDSLFVRTSIS